MRVFNPQAVDFKAHSPRLYRSGNGVFVRKHSEPANIEAVKSSLDIVLNGRNCDWLLLVEGLGFYSNPENRIIDEAINDKEILAFDPIEKPYTPEISKSLNVSPLDSSLAVLIHDPGAIAGIDLSELSNQEVEIWFDQITASIANLFGVSQKDLISSYEVLMSTQNQKSNGFDERIKSLSELLKRLVNSANDLSIVKLQQILQKNKQKNVFVFSGMAHKTVFVGERL